MVESEWMNDTSPLPSGSMSAAIRSLIKAIFDTWKGKNAIDKNQWVVPVILKGSLMLYVALLALVRATPGYRMLCLGALFVYSWINDDGKFIGKHGTWSDLTQFSHGRHTNIWWCYSR